MFQLIVAVISIALVAALAIASIFYGGEAFTKSSEKANVTALINQAQQISGAYQLYKTDFGNGASDVDALVTGKYLAAAPNPSKIATGVWEIDAATGRVTVDLTAASAPTLTTGACAEVIRQAGGTVDATTGVGTALANAQFSCEGAATPVKFTFKL
jgi:type II secretory pathway pseudopilin PulG